MEINSDSKFVTIDGKKYPVELWDEKYGEQYGVDHCATSLSYYHRKTMDMLLKLNIVRYYQPPDGIDFTCELTPYFVSLCASYSEQMKKRGYETFYVEDLLQNMAKENKIKLRKKLLLSMSSLIQFIEQWGKKGQIWIK